MLVCINGSESIEDGKSHAEEYDDQKKVSMRAKIVNYLIKAGATLDCYAKDH